MVVAAEQRREVEEAQRLLGAAPIRWLLDRYGLGERWWPIFGAAYFLVAVKRVRGARLIGPAWKTAKSIATAPVPLANRRSHRHRPGLHARNHTK